MLDDWEDHYELPRSEGRVAFVQPWFPPRSTEAVQVLLRAQLDLRVTMPLTTWSMDHDRLVDWFTALDAHWRGWVGERFWADEPESFGATASHDERREVRLNFRHRTDRVGIGMEPVPWVGHWAVDLAVSIEPGALGAIHEGVRGLLTRASADERKGASDPHFTVYP